MNNQNFDSLIDRYLKGQLNEEEVVFLEKWLDSLEDKELFDKLPAAELAIAKKAMYERINKKNNIFRLSPYLKVAASVIVLVIAGYIFRDNLLNFIAPHRDIYVAGTTGNIKKQILSDGSIVWLKGNSKLTFPLAFGSSERTVTLQGEALFEVAKDAQRPFMIHCGSLITKVLGTSFNIRNTGRETAVSVLTGKLSLTNGKSTEILLSANENAVYSEQQSTIKKAKETTVAIRELTKGTEYDMSFNDAGMRDVIHRIEKKFDVDIHLKDTAIIVNNLFTADMTDQSLEKTMEMICQALNLEVKIKGQTILLQPRVS
jgi:ferric-dicitrate binding protein FerR (iron transport regulator)